MGETEREVAEEAAWAGVLEAAWRFGAILFEDLKSQDWEDGLSGFYRVYSGYNCSNSGIEWIEEETLVNLSLRG